MWKSTADGVWCEAEKFASLGLRTNDIPGRIRVGECENRRPVALAAPRVSHVLGVLGLAALATLGFVFGWNFSFVVIIPLLIVAAAVGLAWLTVSSRD